MSNVIIINQSPVIPVHTQVEEYALKMDSPEYSKLDLAKKVGVEFHRRGSDESTGMVFLGGLVVGIIFTIVMNIFVL